MMRQLSKPSHGTTHQAGHDDAFGLGVGKDVGLRRMGRAMAPQHLAASTDAADKLEDDELKAFPSIKTKTIRKAMRNISFEFQLPAVKSIGLGRNTDDGNNKAVKDLPSIHDEYDLKNETAANRHLHNIV